MSDMGQKIHNRRMNKTDRAYPSWSWNSMKEGSVKWKSKRRRYENFLNLEVDWKCSQVFNFVAYTFFLAQLIKTWKIKDVGRKIFVNTLFITPLFLGIPRWVDKISHPVLQVNHRVWCCDQRNLQAELTATICYLIFWKHVVLVEIFKNEAL